ncbi:ATP-binding cassette domain-containing protein [Sulfurovum sp. XGS-02]|uniref:ABC transporter ATP-binding protein n=1 Tax=Sulfurovum sp. XGS-02 TaxID=2925411 RepID=UPI002053712D|nr:ATP-binding cassette domain-containing protein [Sulfurovum sp. XGS-02]UPT78179.1 ATP-binding cassette domain-containing protein [Sulfurovum sp. XGS-02]
MIQIEIHKRLHGAYGDMDLDVNLEIQKGEFIALIGESGSGKTTLLRILAGLEKAVGTIKVEDLLWLGGQKMLPPQQREIGFIFQDYALFEHMNVEENLLFVKKDKGLAQRLLAMTELSRLSHRNVKGLSGGQKQRVSLCRALMKQPKLLLMDEPLSALDPAMRTKLQEEILRMHKTFGITTIMVSHDTDASYQLADRIVVLDHGKVIADGRPEEIFVKTTKEVYTLCR